MAATVSYDNEQEEQALDKTFGESQADNIDFGLPPSDPSAVARGEEEPEMADADEEDDEDPGDDVASTWSRRVPSKQEVQTELKARFQPILITKSLTQAFDMMTAETFFAVEGH